MAGFTQQKKVVCRSEALDLSHSDIKTNRVSDLPAPVEEQELLKRHQDEFYGGRERNTPGNASVPVAAAKRCTEGVGGKVTKAEAAHV